MSLQKIFFLIIKPTKKNLKKIETIYVCLFQFYLYLFELLREKKLSIVITVANNNLLRTFYSSRPKSKSIASHRNPHIINAYFKTYLNNIFQPKQLERLLNSVSAFYLHLIDSQLRIELDHNQLSNNLRYIYNYICVCVYMLDIVN